MRKKVCSIASKNNNLSVALEKSTECYLSFQVGVFIVNSLFSPGAKTKKWLVLGISLTHLAERRDLFFLQAEIVGNIFQWDVLRNMGQIKSYDGMFHALRALTVHKILKIGI